MSVGNLGRMFRPHSVAVIGASDVPHKVGYTVLRNLLTAGFQGKLLPINPHRQSVQGLPAVTSLRSLPEPVDLAIVCTPAATVPKLIEECGETGVGGVIILSAGFREFGVTGLSRESEVRALHRRFPQLRILGPNCLGMICPRIGLNASFVADAPRRGDIALISQSGALCTSLLDWALQENIGFSHFVSIGNLVDIGFGDLIDYFGEDPETRSIILYMESLSDSRQFLSAARAFSRTKPIVAYKAGRFPESAKAAAAHTGAVAGDDATYDAVFRRAGIERVHEMSDLFACAELLARQRLPAGPRLAIVTNAGGPGVMAADALLARGGQLAEISDATRKELDGTLPEGWSRRNPIDLLGDATPGRFTESIKLVLQEVQVDGVAVILTPQAMTDSDGIAREVAATFQAVRKPLLASWIGGARVQAGRQLLVNAGIPVYPTPEQAVQAFQHLWSWARNREALYETPRDLPLIFEHDRETLKRTLQVLINHTAGDTLSPSDAQTLLAAYGIPVSRTILVTSADEAVHVAKEMGLPVSMKVSSPQIPHSSAVGGVALDVRTVEGVRIAYAQVLANARSHCPDAVMEGIHLQRMHDSTGAVELSAGMRRDATFGAVLHVGAAGRYAELWQDRALELPPLNERLARNMLDSLRIKPLLESVGKGEHPPHLVEALIRLSYLVADHPEILSLEVSPLLATPTGVIALNARVLLDRALCDTAPRAYSHLAIRPYPEEFVRQIILPDGSPALLRPIKPEDIPLWTEMLNACSAETLHARFQYLFQQATHEMAARFCFLDYDRELALVVEQEVGQQRRFLGVGRLVADTMHDSAEYAVLIIDEWQNRGLGRSLTGHCLEIAERWGIRSITSLTSYDNRRMLSIFDQCGFKVSYDAFGTMRGTRTSKIG